MAVIITPEPGRHKEIGRLLLELADSPYQVQWVTWPTAGYSVPEELFARFDSSGRDAAAPDGGEEETPKRKRGRPRKEESTDNNTSEEEE